MAITRLILTFRLKGRYLLIIIIISFLTINQPLDQKDDILRSLWKIVFCPYFRKYQHIKKNDDILIPLWKSLLLPISLIIVIIMKILFFCGHNSLYINISTLRTLLSDNYKKIVFGNNSLNISLSTKRTIFWDHFEKSCIVDIFENINISRKMTIFWYYFEKVYYCPYLPK